VLRKPLVVGTSGERPPGHQVVLVGDVDDAPTDCSEEVVLHLGHEIDHGSRLGARVHAHRWLRRVATHAERHNGCGRQVGVLVEETSQRVAEHCSVVYTGAHHDLAVYLNPGVEQGAQPAQADRTPPIPEHPGANFRVGGVDADVQRAQPIGDYTLEVRLGEAGQRREVPVQERQPVVVILDVKARSQVLGELVDEAELAVVVAGAHTVEDRRVDLDAQRCSGELLDGRHQVETPAPDVELERGLVGEDLIFDDVAGRLTVHGHDLVAGSEARLCCRRTGRHRHDPRQRHAFKDTPGRAVGWSRAC
jgi:hypothetical protein